MNKLGPFSVPGQFYRGNLHTHCTRSDGVLPVEQVVQTYRDAGYDFLSMTDHFWQRFGFPITDTTSFQSKDFTTILGAELHAPALENGEVWHILANGLPLDFAPTGIDETGVELAARAVASGAFVSIAHPAWYGLSLNDARSLAIAHAVEVYNHGCALECDRGDGWYILDALSAEGRPLHAIATDDAHFKAPDAFGGWVQVKADTLSSEALLAALKAGHFYASQGPQIFDLGLSNDAIEIVCSPARVVTAVGSGAAAVHQIGDGLTRVQLSRERLKHSSYFRLVVIDHHGRRAWTNPFVKR